MSEIFDPELKKMTEVHSYFLDQCVFVDRHSLLVSDLCLNKISLNVEMNKTAIIVTHEPNTQFL